MTDITIPPDALEAAARGVYEAWCKFHGVEETSLPWEDIDDEERQACFAEALAACLAMLRAWPGMFINKGNGGLPVRVHLPLPKENSND